MIGLLFSSFGDSVIVGLQTVRSIDFLSDAMKPGVPSLCKLAGWEGGRQRTYNMAHLRKAEEWNCKMTCREYFKWADIRMSLLVISLVKMCLVSQISSLSLIKCPVAKVFFT